ncbi:MAG: SHOCT domain-containing protein [Methanobrevibacter sp.]|jgi:hypothetical protein|nr:SHOCT domain-containing protein [Candidatus Methanovirga aequatorialis]
MGLMNFLKDAGIAESETVGQGYFERRKLRKAEEEKQKKIFKQKMNENYGEFKYKLDNGVHLREKGLVFVYDEKDFTKNKFIPLNNITDVQFTLNGSKTKWGTYDVFTGWHPGHATYKGQTKATVGIVIYYMCNGKEEKWDHSWEGSDDAVLAKQKELEHAFNFIQERRKNKDNNNKDIVTQLKEAKELLDGGVLTQEEFDELKRKLLN